MTLLEALKQLLGSKADEEITDASENSNEDQQKEHENEEIKDRETEETVTSETENDDTGQEEVIEDGGGKMSIFAEGWYNSETGNIDESKISDPEVLGAIKQITSRYEQEKNNRLIADKLNDELKNYILNVSDETFRKVLDLKDVKINGNGEVTGVKEAIEALKTAEPTFFKDKDKESSPLNEGFNPVEKKNTGVVNSFDQAFRLMEEING